MEAVEAVDPSSPCAGVADREHLNRPDHGNMNAIATRFQSEASLKRLDYPLIHCRIRS